jgi:hypothetical protein
LSHPGGTGKAECAETNMARHYQTIALLLAALIASACATGPEYQPRTPGSLSGYTDLQLSPNRYRVAFTGSYVSTRDDVEMYLLRRAAEVTLQSGFRHFVFQKRDTQPMTEYYGSSYPYSLYYPYYGDAWLGTTYSSSAEILLLTDDEAAKATDVVDAQKVLLSFNTQDLNVRTAAAAK